MEGDVRGDSWKNSPHKSVRQVSRFEKHAFLRSLTVPPTGGRVCGEMSFKCGCRCHDHRLLLTDLELASVGVLVSPIATSP